MNNKQLPVPLLPREITWGIRYLLFQLVFLGSLLSATLSCLMYDVTAVDLDTVYFMVNLAAVIWIFHHYLRESIKYGISHWIRLLVVTLLGFLIYRLLFLGIDALIQWLRPEFYNVNDAAIAENTRDRFWITALGAVVLVPLAEETLYRGLVFGAVQQKSRVMAYVLSVVIFAGIHIMGYVGTFPITTLMLCFLQYIPAGLVLAWAYEISGSILAPVLIHTAVNTLAILSMR